MRIGPAAMPSRNRRRLSLDCSGSGAAGEERESAESLRDCIEKVAAKHVPDKRTAQENKWLIVRFDAHARSNVKAGDGKSSKLLIRRTKHPDFEQNCGAL